MLLKSLVPLVLSLVVILSVVVQADEYAQRRFLKECIDKELVVENKEKEFNLSDKDLATLMEIVNKQIDKNELKDTPKEELKGHLKEIEDEAKKTMPKVPLDTVDKMMVALKAKSMHCNMEMPS
ncbi:hypothetical protein BGZ89_004762 [Linnemannia elongata]|nr:hypothetical protein BGZ89_004762 [Linnemannia elongata]